MTDLKSNNEFDSLETFFNKRLKDASELPDEGAWKKIEEELNKHAAQKQKRRFFWYFSSALLLLCGVATLWHFMTKNKTTENTIAAKPIKKENVIQPAVKNTETETKNENIKNTKTEIKIETSKTETPVNASEKSVKIQLGAFKNPADLSVFNKIQYKVIEEKSKDGYIRYYAETDSKENGALEKIQQAGFTDAFVKNNFNESGDMSTVKNEGVPEQNLIASSVTFRKTSESKTSARQNQNAQTKSNAVAVNTASLKNSNQEVKRETAAEIELNKSTSNSTVVKNENNSDVNSIAKNENQNEQTNIPVVTETKKEEIKTEVKENSSSAGVTGNQTAVTKPDSTGSTISTAVAAENKADTTKKEEEPKYAVTDVKSDSSVVAVKRVVSDTAKISTFIPELAVFLTGGPNIFSGNAQSNLYDPSGENHPATYNGEVKLQWRPIKLFSFSGGINYTSFSSKQDATVFNWNKKQTDDFLFYSPFGSMPVAMSTMNQGYYTGVPFDTFYAKYTYSSTLQTLNIPLEANIHFLTKSKLSLYFGLGANTSIALAQHTHLTIIKENFNNEVTYNNVNANKFNFMLLVSLGCDIRLTKHLYLTLTPSYKYGLTNLSSVGGTTYKPAYFSGNAGIKFKF